MKLKNIQIIMFALLLKIIESTITLWLNLFRLVICIFYDGIFEKDYRYSLNANMNHEMAFS